MIEAGLSLPDVPRALDMLKRLDETSSSAEQTLKEFIEIVGADPELLDVGVKEMYENISADLPVFSLDRAIEVIDELSLSHQLALVTVGKEAQQLAKMKKAGIEPALFSKIVVSRDRNKKPHYQAIIEELGMPASEVVVCGDRIAVDLAPAKELGLKTVQMRWGRGLNAIGSRSDVDYTISQLADLKEIIASLTFDPSGVYDNK